MLQRSSSWLVMTMLIVSGCAHYWLPEREFDAYAAVPRAARKHVVVSATRASDGKATFIRASEARLEPISDGTRRRVRVLRPLTTSGIILMATGAAWFVGGILAITGGDQQCKGDSCGLGGFLVGLPMVSAAGVELTIGAVLTGVGAGTPEVRAGSSRFQYLP